MNWTKLLYGFIIALLYVPMVFLGANVFFPKYTGTDSYYQPVDNCYPPTADMSKLPIETQQTLSEAQQNKTNECLVRQRTEQTAWDEGRKVYNGWKYTAITGFNLVIMLAAVLLTGLMDVVMMGVFFGTVVTAFIATVNYWDYARTPIGFGLMLVLFFVVLWFINRRAKMLKDFTKK
jgi:hypothetical protein